MCLLLLLLLHIFFFSTLLFLGNLATLPALSILPEPDPVDVQSQPLLPTHSPPATIPAFPEQSNVAGCPLDISDDLYHGIKSACVSSTTYSGQIHRTRCCPVLAAWLYSAYSKTALHRAVTKHPQSQSTTVDMPVLPDDSEACVDSLDKALENRGIVLVKPNETCDVVFCYCGIRLHPLSCPEAFSVNSKGKLVGDHSVKRLEKQCLSNTGLAGCSNCLNSLYLLSEGRVENTSRSDDRTSKMRSRDCQLMGLTWLLNKNRSGYIHTVSAVLRALMTSKHSSNPQSCTLDSDGMPLAVDSSEINDQSSAVFIQTSLSAYMLPFLLLYINFIT